MAKWQHIPLTDFTQLSLPDSPNYCLASGSECHTKRQIAAPIFTKHINELQETWLNISKNITNTKLLQHENHHLQFVQFSKLFRFPDMIDMEFIDLDEQKSSVNIFSRSIYGHYDFNVNVKRVKYWLQLLVNTQ